jgi:hypothetical protein
MEENTQLEKITSNFNKNIHSLIVFSNTIGSFADEHDQKVKDSIQNSLAQITSNLEKVLDELPRKNKSDKDDGELDFEEQKREFISKLENVLLSKKHYRKSLPIQGNLLRKSALISLMCILETLISQLLREFYQKYPEALPSNAKNLSLSELRELGSVEEAELYLIDSEIDSILRGNIQSQLECFEKYIKISLKPIERYRENIVELSQRRNLLVHNDGKINKHYLNKSPKHLRDGNVNEGDKIKVNSSYLTDEIQSVHLIGIILIQQCFRKWEKSKSDVANKILIDLLFDSLTEKNYKLTEYLAEYSYSIDIKNDQDLRIIVVNHCIALRDLGKVEEMDKVLSKYDWSAVSLTFKLALSVLRNEEDNAYGILDRVLAIGEIDAPELDSWPLFGQLRNTERFNQYMLDKFPDFKHLYLEKSKNTEEIEEQNDSE